MLLPCTVAKRAVPALAASQTRSVSAFPDSSSTASTWGFITRSRSGSACAFGQPLKTSVQGPKSSWGTPSFAAAISRRSSATLTRNPRQLIQRTRSRRKVVFPLPGGPRIRVEHTIPSAQISSAALRATPGTALASRITKELTFRRPTKRPSRITASPHKPIRHPSSSGRYSPDSSSRSALGENPVARSSSVWSKRSVT